MVKKLQNKLVSMVAQVCFQIPSKVFWGVQRVPQGSYKVFRGEVPSMDGNLYSVIHSVVKKLQNKLVSMVAEVYLRFLQRCFGVFQGGCFKDVSRVYLDNLKL